MLILSPFLSDLELVEHEFHFIGGNKYKKKITKPIIDLFGMSKEQCLTDKITFLDFGYLSFQLKLENCVCKTQVMPPPCPKPVLTPCPILTHDPQHIQSILETNVRNVSQNCSNFVKNYIFVCKKTHAHLQYAFNSCAKFHKNSAECGVSPACPLNLML